eukprot:TRINITY_DN3961_c0_g1_i2.p1 TRINITY_DN3961_c0_g1~~TRINITY_DN3961_c0_g1_i2.p1  ORF type:complete len:762 (-),score=126.01 TRINITY_DN3961_c0_g1_i2:63-2348(-)
MHFTKRLVRSKRSDPTTDLFIDDVVVQRHNLTGINNGNLKITIVVPIYAEFKTKFAGNENDIFDFDIIKYCNDNYLPAPITNREVSKFWTNVESHLENIYNIKTNKLKDEIDCFELFSRVPHLCGIKLSTRAINQISQKKHFNLKKDDIISLVVRYKEPIQLKIAKIMEYLSEVEYGKDADKKELEDTVYKFQSIFKIYPVNYPRKNEKGVWYPVPRYNFYLSKAFYILARHCTEIVEAKKNLNQSIEYSSRSVTKKESDLDIWPERWYLKLHIQHGLNLFELARIDDDKEIYEMAEKSFSNFYSFLVSESSELQEPIKMIIEELKMLNLLFNDGADKTFNHNLRIIKAMTNNYDLLNNNTLKFLPTDLQRRFHSVHFDTILALLSTSCNFDKSQLFFKNLSQSPVDMNPDLSVVFNFETRPLFEYLKEFMNSFELWPQYCLAQILYDKFRRTIDSKEIFLFSWLLLFSEKFANPNNKQLFSSRIHEIVDKFYPLHVVNIKDIIDLRYLYPPNKAYELDEYALYLTLPCVIRVTGSSNQNNFPHQRKMTIYMQDKFLVFNFPSEGIIYKPHTNQVYPADSTISDIQIVTPIRRSTKNYLRITSLPGRRFLLDDKLNGLQIYVTLSCQNFQRFRKFLRDTTIDDSSPFEEILNDKDLLKFKSNDSVCWTCRKETSNTDLCEICKKNTYCLICWAPFKVVIEGVPVCSSCQENHCIDCGDHKPDIRKFSDYCSECSQDTWCKKCGVDGCQTIICSVCNITHYY